MRPACATLALFLAASVGCSINPATHQAQFVLASAEQERAMGLEMSLRVEESMDYVDDPKVAAYVSGVGRAVAAQVPESPFTYEFHVVDMAEPNAFAIPGGFVYVSRGLLALTNSEAELAGILGHEIGHVAARHGANQASLQAPVRIVTGLGAFATGIVSPSLGDAVSGASAVATDALFSSYSRDQEREADQLGQRFMAPAGYDPAALSTALGSLHQYAVQYGHGDGPSFFSSHPSTLERVESTRVRAQEMSAVPRPSGRAAHLDALDGLLMGPDPAEGVFVGSDFLHPEMGFTIRFPKGWETANARDFVAARSKRSLILVALAGEGNDPMQTARAVEKRDNVDLRLRAVPVGDLAAARGEAKAHMEGHDAILDVLWIAHRGLIYQVIGVSPIAETARATVLRSAETFRPITHGDRSRIRVERLRITTARAGETMASLARRTGSRKEARELEVLNGWTPGGRFEGGERVKIVREERY